MSPVPSPGVLMIIIIYFLGVLMIFRNETLLWHYVQSRTHQTEIHDVQNIGSSKVAQD